MKKIKLLAIALVCSMAFSSCSSEENMLPEEQGKELSKTYQLKRDASGAYTIDFESNVKTSKIKNASTNTNELYLSISDDDFVQKTSSVSDLWFNDDNFKITLLSNSFNKAPSISILDDNAKFSQKSDNAFLKEYSITKNEDGTYGLDFTVDNNVSVDFVYNTEIGAYEIHLEESEKSNGINNYSRILEKEQNILLQIHFVNHTSDSAKAEAEAGPRKPVIIIDDGEDLPPY